MENTIIQETLGKLAFLRIFKTLAMALSHNKMVLALVAVALIGLTGFIMDKTNTVVYQKTLSGQITSELDVFVANSHAVDKFIKSGSDNGLRTGVFSTLTSFITNRFNNFVINIFDGNISELFASAAAIGLAFAWAFAYHTVYAIIFTLVVMAIISFAGGAICRIAALELARGEKLGALEALKFSKERFLSLFMSMVIPACLISILGIAILLLGLLGNIPYVGEIVIGLGLIFALILGTIMTAVIIGTIGAGGFMFPVIAYEGTDCFDVTSRIFSYFYSKPWYSVLYYIIAIIYGGFCYFVVRFFAFVTLSITYLFLWLMVFTDSAANEGVNKLSAIWSVPQFLDFAGSPVTYSAGLNESISAFLIKIAVAIVSSVVAAFVISFICCANTIIYTLIRHEVDNVPMNKIYHPIELLQQKEQSNSNEE